LDVQGLDERHTASVMAAARFAGLTGDDSIDVRPQLAPVYHGGLVYRAQVVSVTDGELTVASDGAPPDVLRRAEGVWDLDFDFARLRRAGTVRLTVGGRARSAVILAGVTEVALTTEAPLEVWPAGDGCAAPVQACLDALPGGELDTETCGAYLDVVPCNVRAELPRLDRAPDDRSAIEAAQVAALDALPPEQDVEIELLALHERSLVPSNREQMVRAYLAYADLPGEQELHDEATPTSVQATLAEWRLGGLTAVIADLVGSHELVVGELTHAGTRARTIRLLLYFPDAARLAIVTLTDWR